MYIPVHFLPDEEEVNELVANLRAADLVTATAQGLLVTMLPLVYDAPGSRPEERDETAMARAMRAVGGPR